jgi:hypothetical protein
MEVLVASSLFIIVAGAAIDAFVTMLGTTAENARQQDSQQQARQSEIVLSRQLRNLAGPDEGQPQAFDKATAYDIVFKTVDPNGPNAGLNPTNVERVRYCLDSGNPATLWRQVQTWTSAVAPAAPSANSCPDSGWTGTAYRVASNVTNQSNGADRAVFLFDSATLSAINNVRMNLWIDVNPGKPPAETNLQSGVFLRNQNQPPTASFQWTQGGNHHVLLNGSTSADPEGEQLTYTWKDGSTKIGDGIVFDWNAGAAGTHSITLEARDPASLVGTATQTVTAP